MLAAIATAVAAAATRAASQAPTAAAEAPRLPHTRFKALAFAPALAAYLLFGLGYIGYMTFVVTLLREERLAGETIVAFFALLGVAVVASSWLWAGLLQRARGGGALALAQRAARRRDLAAGA